MEAVTGEEGLEVYAAAVRACVERGLGVEALQKMLLDEHGVAVGGKRLLCEWIVKWVLYLLARIEPALLWCATGLFVALRTRSHNNSTRLLEVYRGEQPRGVGIAGMRMGGAIPPMSGVESAIVVYISD